MTEPSQTSFFDRARLSAFILPLRYEGRRCPVLWVNGVGRAEAAQARRRLDAIGEQAARLSEDERDDAYGDAHTFWIYAWEMFPDTLYLYVALDAPAVSLPSLSLPPLRAEYLIRCDLEQESIQLLLRTTDESLTCFLRFDAVPAWVQELAPPDSEPPGEQVSPQIRELIRTSLPVYFNKDGYGVIRQQFDAWLACRGRRKHV